MNQEDKLIKQVEKLEDILHSQQKLLGLASEIISGKNKLIELCEMETEMYKRESKRLTTSLIISGIIFAVLAVINLTRLFI
jgi:hypothetical protein